MPQYALAGHVFVCLQGEHVVFLDVQKDRYFALEAQQTGGLDALVRGWPVRATSDVRAPDGDDIDAVQSALIALLLERGLLSTEPQSGKAATPVSVGPTARELSAEGHEGPTPVGVATFWRFLVSALTASLVLRFGGFERAVRRVGRRNETRRRLAASDDFDEQRVHALVATFNALRPYFFTAKDMCLFETLAFSEFLARHRIFPQWVFGVQARPFAAHCWLQQGGVVLNDTTDHVGRYTPIMVV